MREREGERERERERERESECAHVCEMTDSSPWAPAGSAECVCVTQRDSQRGVSETCQDQETEAS